MNKNLFKTVGVVQAANCVNEAGGKAYSLSDEAAFALKVPQKGPQGCCATDVLKAVKNHFLQSYSY